MTTRGIAAVMGSSSSQASCSERVYATSEDACRACATRIIRQLVDDLDKNPRIGLVLSGGSTPRHVLPHLRQAGLDWSRIVVSATDERAVAADHADSTEGMIRALLGPGIAYVGPFRRGSPDVVQLAGAVGAGLPLPVSASLIGMGPDGHTASLFPGRDEVAGTNEGFVSVPETPPHRHPRATMTLPLLLRTRLIAMVVGPEKHAVYERARRELDARALPVSAVFHQEAAPVCVFVSRT